MVTIQKHPSWPEFSITSPSAEETDAILRVCEIQPVNDPSANFQWPVGPSVVSPYDRREKLIARLRRAAEELGHEVLVKG